MAHASTPPSPAFPLMYHIQQTINKLDHAILATPTGNIRNLLCDANLLLMQAQVELLNPKTAPKIPA